MDYFVKSKGYELNNLYAQLKGPVLIRPDINVPVKEETGRIEMESPNARILEFTKEIDVISEFTPTVIIAHQGRPGDKDFVDLNDHATVMNQKMRFSRLFYEQCVDSKRYFGKRLKRRIQDLRPGESLLLDNIRKFPDGLKFDLSTSEIIPFFKDVGIKTCINDGGPLLHRKQDNMALPHIAKTYVGIITYNELETIHDVMNSDRTKAMIVSGAKPKFEAFGPLSESGIKLFTGGIIGILCVQLKGYDIGQKNVDLINKQGYKLENIEILNKVLRKYDIETPVDFVVKSASLHDDRKNVSLEELAESDYEIMDVGERTVGIYADKLKDYETRIRGGPMGVFEKKYDNGIRLLKSILGRGLVVMGGDTIEEIQQANLYDTIKTAGGKVLLGGGAYIDLMAGEPAPSLDELYKLQPLA